MADNLDPEIVRELNESLRGMNDSIQNMIPAMILNTKVMQESAGSVKGNSRSYRNAKATVDDYLNAVSRKSAADRQAADNQKRINDRTALQQKILEEANQGLKAFGKSVMSVSSGMSKYNDTIGSIANAGSMLAKSFGPLGLAVSAVVKVLGFLVQAVNKQNDEILKAADTFYGFGNAGNLSTEAVKEMGRAAGYSTDQLETYSKIIKGLGPNLLSLGVTINQGTKAFSELTTMNEDQLAYYRRLGISQEQYNKYQSDAIRILRASGIQITDQMKSSGQLRRITDSYVESLLVLESLTGKEAEALQKSKEAALASTNVQIELAQQDQQIRDLKNQAIVEEGKNNSARANELRAQAEQLEKNRQNQVDALTVAKERLSSEKLAALQSAIATGTWTDLSAKYANTYPDLIEFAKGIKEGRISAAEIGPYFAQGTKRAIQFYGMAGKLTNSLEWAGEHLEDFALLADQGGRSYEENVELSRKLLAEEKKRRAALEKPGADPLLDLRAEQEKAERRVRIAMDGLGDIIRGPVVGVLQLFMKAIAWAGKGIAKMSDALFKTNIAPLFESSEDIAKRVEDTSTKFKDATAKLTETQQLITNPEQAKKEAKERFEISSKEREQKMFIMEQARDALNNETDASKKMQRQKELETATIEYNLARTKAERDARRHAEFEALTKQKNLDKLREKEAQLLKQKLDLEKELNEEEIKLIDKQVDEGKISREEGETQKTKRGLVQRPGATAGGLTVGGQSAVKTAIGGEESGDNYNIFAGDKPGTNNNLTEKTIAEVMNMQASRKSSQNAAGKYQFKPKTLESLTKEYNIDPNAKFDPAMQERLQDLLMQKNKDVLSKAGIAATPGHIYLAHFLGSTGAINFLTALSRNPRAPASDGMSERAFNDNPGIVYEYTNGQRKERTLAEVYERIVGKIDKKVAAAETADPAKKKPAKQEFADTAGGGRGNVNPESVLPQAAKGGYFQGPKSGYPVELHGNEVVIPIDDKDIIKKVMLTEFMSMNKNIFNMPEDKPQELGSQESRIQEKLNRTLKVLSTVAEKNTPAASGLATDYKKTEPTVNTRPLQNIDVTITNSLKELLDGQKISFKDALTEIRNVMSDGLTKIAEAAKSNPAPGEDKEVLTTVMIEKLDDIIEVMTNQHDTTKELLTYSRV